MKKRLLACGVMLMLSTVVLCSCAEEYVKQESDFSLVVTVSSTEAHVGDVIEVTATLKNLSGRDIPVRFVSMGSTELNIVIGYWPETESEIYGFHHTLEAGKRRKATIKKDVTIVETREFSIEKPTDYEVIAAFSFLTRINSKIVYIYSDKIKVFVTGT